MLSGGEQQLLAVGRALMSDAELLLLDEPSMGLSPVLVREIFKIISEINREGKTVLLVEQNATWRCRSPGARTCWKRAASSFPEQAGNSREIRASARLTWADDAPAGGSVKTFPAGQTN
jgi:ABC-type siderophore export system fused ATPase/permease subunit